jgi:hypothetical protein
MRQRRGPVKLMALCTFSTNGLRVTGEMESEKEFFQTAVTLFLYKSRK